MNRRQFIGGLALASGALAIPLARGLSIQRARQQVKLWNDGGPALRVAHLSDLHSSPSISLNFINEAIDLALIEPPDLICVTGDFVTDRAPDPEGLVRALRRLSNAAPTFACLGNHDGGAWSAQRGDAATPDAVLEILESSGIQPLLDKTELLQFRERELLLTGVYDLWSHAIDPRTAGFAPDSRRRIVLAHNPDTKDELARVPWDLMLSGHTHGGQIRLPFFGGRLTAPVRDARYIEGLLPWNDRQIHISRGVGCLHGIRINCPPEVTLLALV